MKVAVIGAGLFGSIIAAQLRAAGRTVTVIDDARPASGSRPAACLMKPSWFSSMPREEVEASLGLLDRLYGVQGLAFTLRPTGLKATVHWVDPAKVLKGEDLRARVREIVRWEKSWKICFANDRGIMRPPIFVDRVVVATGVWTEELAPIFKGLVTGQAGVAFLAPNQTVDEPFIKVWAPYKQIVAFNRGDGAWVGDGSSIKAANWTDEHETTSYYRCKDAFGCTDNVRPLFGIRPYVKGRPYLLDEPYPGYWVATGGAKNGTVAAGWVAHDLDRRLQ